MTWEEAIDAMRQGAHVRRSSESTRTLMGHSGGVPIYDCGTEACFLAYAWTDDGRPVRVFCGSGSKAMFVPDSDQRLATDWITSDH